MSIKVVVFDLDDTLYDELDYVRSGLRVVADYLTERFNWSDEDTNRQLLQSLAVNRSQIFDRVLTQKGVWSERLVDDCVSIYREHIPNIRLSNQIKRLLKSTAEHYPIYIVTDGHAGVQQNKLDVLGLTHSPYIQQCFVTYALGMDYAKPSSKCFELIAAEENCKPDNIVYIADNIQKDFVGIKPLGFKTIRVLTGQYQDLKLDALHDAEYQAVNLHEAISLLQNL